MPLHEADYVILAGHCLWDQTPGHLLLVSLVEGAHEGDLIRETERRKKKQTALLQQLTRNGN
jgi:hypothetical protein